MKIRSPDVPGGRDRRGKPPGCRAPRLIHIAHGAGTRAAGIAARTAGSGGRDRRRGALCRDGEHGELRFQLCGVAFGALGLFFAVHEGLELMVTLLADVFKNGHWMDSSALVRPGSQGTPETSPRLQLSRLLKSICGEFANPRTAPEDVPVQPIQPIVLAKSRFVPRSEMAFWRPRADHRQFPAAAPDPSARTGRAAGRSCPRSEGALLGLL